MQIWRYLAADQEDQEADDNDEETPDEESQVLPLPEPEQARREEVEELFEEEEEVLDDHDERDDRYAYIVEDDGYTEEDAVHDVARTIPPREETPAGDIGRTLSALRRKMEEGLDDEPLPLIFGRKSGPAADVDADIDDEVDGRYGPDDDDVEILDAAYDEEDEWDDEEFDDDDVLDQWNGDDELPERRETGLAGNVDKKPAKSGGRPYSLPIDTILHQYSDGRYWEIDDGTRDAGEVLRVTLEEFGIRAEVTGIRKGPVITMFEILPAPGVKLTKITNLADNIALRLAASSVRIVAPIPGKHAVGIEIPNKERNIVSFGELLRDDEFFGDDHGIPIALGKDIAGEAQIVDLTRTPHLLIAGATGSGKSVCVNSIICSVLYRRRPADVKLILIDPKIVELKFYNDIPHLLTPVITDPKRGRFRHCST